MGEVRMQDPPPASAGWTVRYAFAALAVAVALGLAEGWVFRRLLGSGALRLGLSGVAFDLTILATLLPLYRRRPLRPRDLGLRAAPAAGSVMWVTLAYVIYVLASAVYLRAVLHEHGTLGIALRGSPAQLSAAGLFICLSAPVTEEVFFRGVMYRALRNRLGVVAATLVVGVVFGLVHGLSYPFATLPPRALFGVIACLLYERTGSLLPGIALHILVDAGGFEELVSGSSGVVLLIFAALGIALVLTAAARGTVRTVAPRWVPPGHETPPTHASPDPPGPER